MLTPLCKRFAVALPLGALAGVACAAVTLQNTENIFGSWLTWTIISDRIVLGVLVALAGFLTRHPLFKFRTPWWLRGAVMWTLASLPLAFGSQTDTNTPLSTLWIIIGGGLLLGLVIDLLATKIGGEGKDLLAE